MIELIVEDGTNRNGWMGRGNEVSWMKQFRCCTTGRGDNREAERSMYCHGWRRMMGQDILRHGIRDAESERSRKDERDSM